MLVYFREANRSVSEARKTAMASGSQKKIQYSIEYAKKVQALRSQLEQLVREIKSTYTGYNPDTTLIPESMLTEGVGAGAGGASGDESLGRPQKGKKGKGGGGDEGADFDAENKTRRYDIAPFGPFMNLDQINQAKLIKNTALFQKVRGIFGPNIDIDRFSDQDSVIPIMNIYKGKSPELYGGEFIQALFNLLVDIQTQWNNQNKRKYLPQEYLKAQLDNINEWRTTLRDLSKDFTRSAQEAKESITPPAAPAKYK